jgi:uncharacterized protein (DUF1330 family)
MLNYSNETDLKSVIGSGKILWQGKSGFEWIGQDNEEWKNVYIVQYSSPNIESAIERFKKAEFTQLNLLSVTPSFTKVRLVKLMMRSVLSWLPFKLSVNEGVNVEQLLKEVQSPILPSSNQFSRLYENGQGENPVAMLNFLKYRSDPLYPSDFTGKPEKTGAAAYNKYGTSVLRVVSKLGGYILHQGKVEEKLIGDKDISWEEYAIMRYPDRHALRVMFSLKGHENDALKIHRDAGLEKTKVIALNEV